MNDSWVALAGIFVTLFLGLIGVRRQLRNDKDRRLAALASARQKELDDAIKPYTERIAELQASQHQVIANATEVFRSRIADLEESRRQAIADAVSSCAASLASMTEDRNYWRDQAHGNHH